MRKQFTFYASFFEAVSELPDGEREAVYDAVCAFALKGERRELPGIAQRVAMKLILPNLIASRAKALAAQGKSGDLNANGKSKKKDKKEIENKKENEIEAEAKIEGQGESREADGERARLEREFDCFWLEYPIKLGRDSALQLWLEQKPNLEEMLEALRRWRARIGSSTASGVLEGLVWGLRLRSVNSWPVLYRSIHLYPVCRVIPNSRHRALKLLQHLAACANSFL